MVVFFLSECPEVECYYMGKDKFENEDLIKYALPHDIWFHVDEHSSAHVYLRMRDPKFDSYEKLPEQAIKECAILTKANSIQGCKLGSVNVIYTWARNLSKKDCVEVGSVNYHDRKQVIKVLDVKKDNNIIRQLMKTKKESFPRLDVLKEEHMSKMAATAKAERK